MATTNTFRNLILSWLFIAVIPDAIAQKFIEVTASDSVMLQPSRITFMIKVERYGQEFRQDMMGMDFGEHDEFSEDQIAEKQKALRKFLTSNNIPFYEKETPNLTLAALKSVGVSYFVDVKNVAEGEALLQKLKAFDGIQAGVLDLQYDRTETVEKILLQRILAKARKDAELLASLSGVKTGPIIEIRETTQEDHYSSIPLNEQWHDTIDWTMYIRSREVRQEYSRTFTVKFQIVD